MNQYNKFFLLRFGYVWLVGLVLGSCSHLLLGENNSVKPIKNTPVAYTATEYVKHLALAQLGPENNAGSREIINAYSVQKIRKGYQQNVLIIDYKKQNQQGMQFIIAPLEQSKSGDKFNDLFEIMKKLAGTEYTLHNLALARVSVIPQRTMKLPDHTDEDIAPAVAAQEQNLKERSQALAPLEDIAIQLQLIRFFIDHRFREGAYIAVDNVKRLLAASHSQPQNETQLMAFSKELDELESLLRKLMPFTL